MRARRQHPIGKSCGWIETQVPGAKLLFPKVRYWKSCAAQAQVIAKV